jgi:hypothetical protein
MRVVAQRSLGTRSGRLVAIGLATALVLATAALGFFLVTRGATIGVPANGGSPSPSDDATADSDTTRSIAAAWIADNVAEGTIVACDPAACADLEWSGYLPTALVTLRIDSADVREADLVMVTPAVRARLGATLDQLVAPTPLAIFGTADSSVEVREISLDGPDGYQQRWSADRTDRLSAGRALAMTRGLHLTGQARTQLVRGNVDSRILTTLSPLLAAHDIWISRFAASGPEGSRGILRIMEIDHIDGRKIRDGAGRTAEVVGYFRSQRPPYLPSAVEVSAGAQGIVLSVTYPAPSPFGLLSAQKN